MKMNIRQTLEALKNDDGLTLKNYESINYKTGYQVATEGIETTSVIDAVKAILFYNGNCGVWFSNGIYYVDKSHRVTTKKEALRIGKACNQISVLKWSDMSLVYCDKQ